VFSAAQQATRHRIRASSSAPLVLLLLASCCVAPLIPRAHAKARQQRYGAGLSVEIDHPPEQVLDIVREIAADNFIRGTSQYKDTAQIDGAVPVTSCKLFKDWTEGGTVLYKIRAHTLSPEHFDESGDEGTVAVRYVVQPINATSTRLKIDAVFQEDARRTIHPSDGTPENGEFLAIEAKIKDVEEKEAEAKREAGAAVQEQRIGKLQSELDQEVTDLRSIEAKQKEVEQQIAELQRNKAGHIRTPSADLKAAPYTKSKTLQALTQGDTVTVLLQTPNWYRVVAPNGEQGWVYRMMIEVVQ
jgi:SH3 domain-containing protein